MNSDLNNLIDNFVKNNPLCYLEGTLTTIDSINNTKRKIRKLIPDWYKQLLIKYPIANSRVGVPNDFGQEELKNIPFEQMPLMTLKFHDIETIEIEMVNYFPGNELIKARYICIGQDYSSTQEGIYINVTEKDPEVVLIIHDLGRNRKELLENKIIILDHFSEIFKYGKYKTGY